MTNNPGDDVPDGDDNPFKGTPFEQFFANMGGNFGALFGQGGAGGAGMPDLGALFGQIQAMMQPYDGALNWDAALDMARRAVAQEQDPSPSQKQQEQVADAVRLADLWLDETTEFGSGVQSTAAWSRAEWLVGTLDRWKRLVEPIAESSVAGIGNALPGGEAQAMAAPIMGMLGKAVGAMLASQVGSGLGALAGEVLSASDVGLPLGATGKAAIVVENVKDFAAGLDVSEEDVLLYLALREAAHQRLFAHVPWLRGHLIAAVEDYGRGTTIDVSKIESSMEEQMQGVDPTNPESMQALLDGGLFDLPRSAAQDVALQRLEVTLALVE